MNVPSSISSPRPAERLRRFPRVVLHAALTLTPTPPAVSSVEVDGAKVTVTFDEDLVHVASAGLLYVQWTISGTDVDQHPYEASVSGSTVTLTIGTAAKAGQTVTVSYDSGGHLEDAAGNEVASFSATATNQTT